MMTGFLPINKVLFYLILLNSKVPKKDEVQNLIDWLSLMSRAEGEEWKGKVCKGNFITAPTWFDAYEYSVDMKYAKPFNRLKQIKGLIFDVLKSDHDSLDIKEFEKLIKMRMKEHDNDDISFSDMLFKTKEDQLKELEAWRKWIWEEKERELKEDEINFNKHFSK